MEKKFIEIPVRVMREIVYKQDSNWGNFACVPASHDDYSHPDVHFNDYGNITCVGIVHRLDIGSVYNMKAEVVHDQKWGYQYKLVWMKQDIPSTPEQQKEYIRMLVTPLQFKAIYDVYEGADIIQLFKDNTFDFKKVYGFGEITYNVLRNKVLSNLELQELLNEFPMLDYNILKRLRNMFENATLLAQKMRENPYILTDYAGVGFKTADKIALEIGIPSDSPFRIHAAIRHIIREVENDGDTYIKESKMISGAYEILKVKRALIKAELDDVQDIVRIDDRYSLKETFLTEVMTALKLRILNENCEELVFNVEEFVVKMEDKYKIKLTDQQKGLFYNLKKYGVNFLIGYAGTGKSMLQKLIIELAEELGLSYKLLAPTGKASKVLGKYTKRDAYTIHKAAGIGSSKDDFGSIYIDEDLVIIDESSMCDIKLAKTLLFKLSNPNVRILFLGDSFQIPSVSAGNFLFDCQESGIFAVTMLDHVFRQSEGGILDLATKMRKGEKFIDDDFIGIKKFGQNCLLVSCPQEKMESTYLYYYNRMIKTYGIDGMMVLSPTKKGKLGTFAINTTLQSVVNPKEFDETPEIKMIREGNEVFLREGDRVINNVNTYNVINQDGEPIDIMNGDTGIITNVNTESRSVTIQFEKDIVIFTSAELEKLLHSLCLTMHKSQGSAAKGVIMIADKAHTYQLNANLLYVAQTRPEDFLVILSQANTINGAMKKVENLRRNTFLCEILKDEIEYGKFIVEEWMM